MNKEGEKQIDMQYGLDKYLKYLEKQLGGHGNGYALMKDGKVIKFEKGVNLDVRLIYFVVSMQKSQALIYWLAFINFNNLNSKVSTLDLGLK